MYLRSGRGDVLFLAVAYRDLGHTKVYLAFSFRRLQEYSTESARRGQAYPGAPASSPSKYCQYANSEKAPWNTTKVSIVLSYCQGQTFPHSCFFEFQWAAHRAGPSNHCPLLCRSLLAQKSKWTADRIIESRDRAPLSFFSLFVPLIVQGSIFWGHLRCRIVMMSSCSCSWRPRTDQTHRAATWNSGPLPLLCWRHRHAISVNGCCAFSHSVRISRESVPIPPLSANHYLH